MSAAPLVLVVDDEAAIRTALDRALRLEGFAVRTAAGGREALAAVEAEPPAVIVLDVAMPDLNGRAVAARLRARGIETPICVLSARDEVEDRVAGLQAGADDYLVKPFDFDELLARVRALLRRAGAAARDGDTALRVADLMLDPPTRTVRRGERQLSPTPREFDLLALFMRHPNQVLTRGLLMERIWGPDFFGDSNVLEVYVASLRRALEAAGEPRLIHTVRGVGYVLREPSSR